MSISYEALTVLVFLAPGFIASCLLTMLIVRRRQDTFGRVVEALVFSLIIYAGMTAITGKSPVFLEEIKEGDKTRYSVAYHAGVMAWICGLAVVLPLLVGLFITRDWHMRILRWLCMTSKTSRESVWLDVFIDQRRYVVVHLKDGRRVFGWPMYYSNGPDEGLLYLHNPSWLDDDGNYVDLKAHGLFLVDKQQINSIVFTHTGVENAVDSDQKGAEHGEGPSQRHSGAGGNTEGVQPTSGAERCEATTPSATAPKAR